MIPEDPQHARLFAQLLDELMQQEISFDLMSDTIVVPFGCGCNTTIFRWCDHDFCAFFARRRYCGSMGGDYYGRIDVDAIGEAEWIEDPIAAISKLVDFVCTHPRSVHDS